MSQSFGDMAFSPKGVIWVLSIFERIRLSRYCAAIRERNSCLYHICKKNIFCSKYMIKLDNCKYGQKFYLRGGGGGGGGGQALDSNKFEPVREKTNNLVSDQVRHKPTCKISGAS